MFSEDLPLKGAISNAANSFHEIGNRCIAVIFAPPSHRGYCENPRLNIFLRRDRNEEEVEGEEGAEASEPIMYFKIIFERTRAFVRISFALIIPTLQ